MSRRVCILGGGTIAQVHAQVIRENPQWTLSAVVDPDPRRGHSFAAQWAIADVFTTAAAAVAEGQIDCVHVCAPPDRHCEAAMPFLEAGVPALVEKPLAATEAQCAALILAARKTRAILGTNQNFVHLPAFARLRRTIAAGELGRIRHVSCVYNVPLRQLAARQFGHWMFTEPGNILLEQAVHPLSLIVAIAGRIEARAALAPPPIEISPGVPFYAGIGLQLRCRSASASLQMAVGESFPFWQVTAVCDDGVAVADILYDRFFTQSRSSLMEFLDVPGSSVRSAADLVRDGARFAANYVLSTAPAEAAERSILPQHEGQHLGLP